VNVVPAEAQAEFACRALDTASMEEAYGKVVSCARAAELGTGARLEFKEPRVSLKAPIIVAPLVTSLRDQMNALGVGDGQLKDFDELASSDLGVVGYDYPTADLWFKIAPGGTALHSDALREAANSEEGWKATVTAGKAVALSAYEMLTNPEKLEAVQSAFREMKAKEGK
jgi:metal-dependent amidase/aminoacylase/carboxypeptidase family protein